MAKSKTYYMQTSDGYVYSTSYPELHSDSTRLTVAKGKAALQEQSCRTLREMLRPGDTVYTFLRHKARSGMQREISCYLDGMQCIDAYVADITGYPIGKHDGIVLGGCGMDMGFALVYELSHKLFPNGFGCIGRNDERHVYCPSNDHSNGDRDYTPHNEALIQELHDNGVLADIAANHWHTTGAYALQHRWL
jgi:hypothetical protein